MRSNSNTKLESIQVLRAIASIMVVSFHSLVLVKAWAIRKNLPLPYFDSLLGSAGVDIFFVISGFVITFVSWNHFGDFRQVPSFSKKRFLRLIPSYWLYTLLAALGALLVHRLDESMTLKKLLYSLFFLPTQNADGQKTHVLAVAWTLQYEIFFYACFALCLAFSRKWLIPLLIFIGASVTVMLPLLVRTMTGNPISIMKNSSLLIEFFFGVVIAFAYRSGLRLRVYESKLLILTSLLGFIFWLKAPDYAERCISWGIPSSALVAGAVFYEREKQLGQGWRQFVALGDSSYTLYLIHLPLFAVVLALVEFFELSPNPNLISLALVLLAIAVSEFLYHRVDSKLLFQKTGFKR